MLPKAGVFADAQARVVADNLEKERAGGKPRRRFNGHGSCFLEAGGGLAGMAVGEFYATPGPQLKLRPPRPWWHWSKVWLEKKWLRRFF